jgi:hypothetical protein
MGSNFHDVVPITEGPEFEPLTDELLEAMETRELVGKVTKVLEKKRSAKVEFRPGDVLYEALQEAEHLYHAERRDIFKQNGGNLPPSVLYASGLGEKDGRIGLVSNHEDGLALAAQSPKTTLDELRGIADRMGFSLFPVGVVAQDVLHMADEENGENAVDGFVKGLGKGFDFYVLGPVSIYDIERHVKSKEEATIYWGSKNDGLGAIDMVVPVLQMMDSRIEGIEGKVGGVQKRVDSLSSRLSSLEKTVAEERRQAALERERERQEEQERLEAIRRAAFARRDPLIFAVPKGSDIRAGASFAVIGPCWGDDFDDIVFETLGLEKKTGQREKIEETQKVLAETVMEQLAEERKIPKSAADSLFSLTGVQR